MKENIQLNNINGNGKKEKGEKADKHTKKGQPRIF